MADKIVQRLIAAGATPVRARAFSEQFIKSQPGVKTQDLEDAFDTQLAELSKAFFPNVFRPPTIDDPRINDYVAFVYGPNKFRDIETSVMLKNAPAYTKALNSNVQFERLVAEGIKDGSSLGMLESALTTPQGLIALGKYPLEDAKKLVKTLFDEYTSAKGKIDKAKEDFLATDKTYVAGLPSPKLKYGREENLAQGTISWKSHPQVEKALKQPAVTRAKSLAQTAPAGYIGASGPGAAESFNKMRTDAMKVEDDLFKEFLSSKANPLKDEIKRREFLKEKTIK